MTEDVEPNSEIRHGWHVQIDGIPTVKMHFAAGRRRAALCRAAHGSGHADDRAADGARHPHVVAARPGVVTYKDLPLVTAAHCVRT